MSEANETTGGTIQGFLPRVIAIPLAALLLLLFMVLLFPWDAVGRRIAWEISRVSGARVEVDELAPAISARGPVLRARDVTIQHPAVDRVRVSELEIAPRLSSSWLGGEPTLRVYALTDLGNADGVLRLGETPAYTGSLTEVELSRLPLRLEASALSLRGRLDAEADVALDPQGTLAGRVDFESPGLEIVVPLLPGPLGLDRATGTIEILEDGSTRITGVDLRGEAIEGKLSGEIGLVHRSQSPPIDLLAELTVHDPTLRQLAPNAGLRLDARGHARVVLRGTIDAPRVEPAPAAAVSR